GTPFRRQRLKPRARLLEGTSVNVERTRPQTGQFAPRRTNRTVVGDLLIGLDSKLWVAQRQFRSLPHAGKIAIASGALGHDLGIGAFGLGRLALLVERLRRFEGRAGLSRALGLIPLVGAPAAHPDEDQENAGVGVILVALPQLLQLFAAYFLVDFLEDIGHAAVPVLNDVPVRPSLSDEAFAQAPPDSH